MSNITIIGSGLAGYTLAREIRKLNTTVPIQIFTADDGTYYSKPQLSSAFTHQKTADKLVGASVERIAQQLNAIIHTHTPVTRIASDLQKIYTNDQAFSYGSLVLAQGAMPVKPKLPAVTTQKIMAINNLQDYREFRILSENKKHITILGAGLVGCEFANDLVNGGFQVEVVALSATPLDLLLPHALGEVIQTNLANIGVSWNLGQSITAITQDEEKLYLTLSNEKHITTDLLISAIGLKPILELAQASGITTKQGICVDRYLQTNLANIYALGDCAEVEGHSLLYVAPLVIGARALAHSLTGNKTAASYPPMPIIIKTPASPVVSNPPPPGIQGEWRITGSDANKKALFYDNENNLRGFALTGDTISEKIALVKELPHLV